MVMAELSILKWLLKLKRLMGLTDLDDWLEILA
jgi:hypothetical protein